MQIKELQWIDGLDWCICKTDLPFGIELSIIDDEGVDVLLNDDPLFEDLCSSVEEAKQKAEEFIHSEIRKMLK